MTSSCSAPTPAVGSCPAWCMYVIVSLSGGGGVDSWGSLESATSVGAPEGATSHVVGCACTSLQGLGQASPLSGCGGTTAQAVLVVVVVVVHEEAV